MLSFCTRETSLRPDHPDGMATENLNDFVQPEVLPALIQLRQVIAWIKGDRSSIRAVEQWGTWSIPKR